MWGYTIERWVTDADGNIIGVDMTCDNGDRQYLTMEEYVKFTNSRDERKECKKEG